MGHFRSLHATPNSEWPTGNRAPDVLEVLRLAALGWRLFPCVPREKTPLLKGWPNDASCDANTICAWAERYRTCNWAVACGPGSGVWIVDVDGEAGEHSLGRLNEEHGSSSWTLTLTALTRRGKHLYFQYPQSQEVGTSTSKLGAGLHVRGRGGYAIIPPSVHPDGPIYEWVDSTQAIFSAPGWLLDLVTALPRRAAISASEIGILREGQRNDGLTRLASALRRKGASQSEIERKLLEANARRCQPPLQESEVIKIADSVARYAPGGPDPLERAWEAIQRDPYASGYHRFLALAAQLQLARPEQPVALPLERIAGLMNLHWTMVSRYRKQAVASGLLIPIESYIAHRKAGTYQVSLESLTSITSGLVRLSSKTAVYSPSETVSGEDFTRGPSQKKKRARGPVTYTAKELLGGSAAMSEFAAVAIRRPTPKTMESN